MLFLQYTCTGCTYKQMKFIKKAIEINLYNHEHFTKENYSRKLLITTCIYHIYTCIHIQLLREVDVIQILSSVYIQMFVVDHILMNVFL